MKNWCVSLHVHPWTHHYAASWIMYSISYSRDRIYHCSFDVISYWLYAGNGDFNCEM